MNKVFEEIWKMNTKECKGCGQLKAHHAKGLCFKCYNKQRRETNNKKKSFEI